MEDITFHNEPEEVCEPNDEYRTEKRWLLYVHLPAFIFVAMIFGIALKEGTPLSKFVDVVFGLGVNIAAFAWCRIDSRERGYELHRLFPYAIVILGFFALIYYLFRSRGLVGGLRSTGLMLFYFIVCALAMTILASIVVIILAATGLIYIPEFSAQPIPKQS